MYKFAGIYTEVFYDLRFTIGGSKMLQNAELVPRNLIILFMTCGLTPAVVKVTVPKPDIFTTESVYDKMIYDLWFNIGDS